MLLNLSDISKFYGRQDVLKNAGLFINPGERVGLIGPNGAGKSTLIRVILGEIAPDQGQVSRAKGLRLGYLPQDLMTFTGQTLLDMVVDTAEELRAIETELALVAEDLEQVARQSPQDQEALLELTNRQSHLLERFDLLGGYTVESEAAKILTGLGFEEGDFGRPIDEFSGGWIMRAVLARILLAQPDLLLLDEPTNHLDMDSLLWLEYYLLYCPSALLLVSHDRTFLNNVVQRIVEVDRGQTWSYTGNYDQYLAAREKRTTAEQAAYESQQGKIKQIERFIEKNRVRAATARLAQSRVKMLEKMDMVDAPSSTKPQTFKLTLPPAARGPEILVELDGVTKTYGRRTVYRNIDLALRRGDRLAFLGPNGRGKSTLMKLLAGTTDYQAGQRRMGSNVLISYFAQFQLEDLDLERTVIEELGTVAGDMTPGRMRSILGGFMFRGDDVFKKVGVLSGGEKSRLILAKIMIVGPNLLLLDEPSNHLDIPGRQMLEDALRQYDGTLCLISHDRRLLNAVANKVVVIGPGGTIEVFPGNYDDYHQIWKERLAAGTQAEAPEPEPDDGDRKKPIGLSRAEKEARKKARAAARQELYRQKAPLTREIERLEARLAELGSRLEELSQLLADPETYQDADRSRDLNLEYAKLKDESDRLTESWEQASLKLEELEAAAEAD